MQPVVLVCATEYVVVDEGLTTIELEEDPLFHVNVPVALVVKVMLPPEQMAMALLGLVIAKFEAPKV